MCILNYMVQYDSSRFDASFSALSDATRRGVLEQLGRSDASITELADRFQMTLTGMKKHVSVLEQAGLEEEMAWMENYRRMWAERFDELDKVVEELMEKERADGRASE